VFLQDKEARELQAAQQEVMALRARVHQLETDTHSSSSLELKNLSLQQVCAVLDTAHMCSTGLEPNVFVTIEPPTGLAKAPWVWQRTVCRDCFSVGMCMTTETADEVSTHTQICGSCPKVMQAKFHAAVMHKSCEYKTSQH